MTEGLSRRLRRNSAVIFQHARYLIRAKIRSMRLPPGVLDPFDRSMDTDQRHVMKCAARHGPVFKAWWHGSYTTCIVGNARGRRLLTENEDRLVLKSIDLRTLVPLGWIRTMRGDPHQRYRRILMQALKAAPVAAHDTEFRRVIREELGRLAGGRESPPSRAHIRAALREITTAMMLKIIFGVSRGTPAFAELKDYYRQFGPNAPPHAIDAHRRGVFVDLRRCVDRMRQTAKNNANTVDGACMLRHLIDNGFDDDTALGNLIFLFEPAHFDLYSLWHWLLRYIGGDRRVAEDISSALAANPERAERQIRAIILETLRLNQSEVLYRQAASDISFDGFLIPKDQVVRICMWEAHKDEKSFPQPFAFSPDRFLERDFDIDQFAPFGMDKHRCIGADLTLDLSTLFVSELLKNFICELVSDGPPQMGQYHWEPGQDVAVAFTTR
jgi:cytochrome P450